MTFLINSVLFLLFAFSLLADVPLETNIYITTQALQGTYAFTIKDASTHNGARLILKPYVGSSNQIFKIYYREGYYVFVAQNSQKLLTFNDNKFVIQNSDLAGDYYAMNQDFTLEPRTNPSVDFSLRSRSNGNFLQFDWDFDYVAGHWITKSENILQGLPTFGDYQVWVFVKV